MRANGAWSTVFVSSAVGNSHCRVASRAERFGTPYKEPDLSTILTKKEYLRLHRQKRVGFVTDINLADEEEATKRLARAARYGSTAPSARAAELVGKPVDPSNLDSFLSAVAELRAADTDRFESDDPILRPLVAGAPSQAPDSHVEPAEAVATSLAEAEATAAATPSSLTPAEVVVAEDAALALLRLPGQFSGGKHLEALRQRFSDEQILVRDQPVG